MAKEIVSRLDDEEMEEFMEKWHKFGLEQAFCSQTFDRLRSILDDDLSELPLFFLSFSQSLLFGGGTMFLVFVCERKTCRSTWMIPLLLMILKTYKKLNMVVLSYLYILCEM